MISREPKKSYTSNMKYRITFQANFSTTDGEGGFDNSWVDIQTVWAEVSPIYASQRFEYKSVNVDATHRIKIRGGFIVDDDTTKMVSDTWTITWDDTLFVGTVQLDYQIGSGSWVLINAAAPNTGTYSWTIPLAAIGKQVRIRIS